MLEGMISGPRSPIRGDELSIALVDEGFHAADVLNLSILVLCRVQHRCFLELLGPRDLLFALDAIHELIERLNLLQEAIDHHGGQRKARPVLRSQLRRLERILQDETRAGPSSGLA